MARTDMSIEIRSWPAVLAMRITVWILWLLCRRLAIRRRIRIYMRLSLVRAPWSRRVYYGVCWPSMTPGEYDIALHDRERGTI